MLVLFLSFLIHWSFDSCANVVPFLFSRLMLIILMIKITIIYEHILYPRNYIKSIMYFTQFSAYRIPLRCLLSHLKHKGWKAKVVILINLLNDEQLVGCGAGFRPELTSSVGIYVPPRKSQFLLFLWPVTMVLYSHVPALVFHRVLVTLHYILLLTETFPPIPLLFC